MSDWLAPLDRWAKDLGVLGLFDGLPQAISNARKLAEGRLNLVIVMIGPCNNHAITSYDEMVEKSPTLQEVRRLIRTYFDCDIDDVSVFDIRPLISERMRNVLGGEWPAWEEKAHRVFEEMLLIKRPDVILSLQCVTKNSKSAISRSLCGNRRVSLRPRIVALGSHETLVFRGFHPSVYLRTDYAADTIDSTTSESMLSRCFKAAFSALQYARNMSPVELYENINHVSVISLNVHSYAPC
jgi:hypothetical protein